jgi:hypothetical protein
MSLWRAVLLSQDVSSFSAVSDPLRSAPCDINCDTPYPVVRRIGRPADKREHRIALPSRTLADAYGGAMPTIKHEPRWGAPDGYRPEDECSFTGEQIAELAAIAGADPEGIDEPLQEAAAHYGRLRYTLDAEPSPAEQRASLKQALVNSDALYIALQSLTPTDRRSLREQYAGGQFDDPDGMRRRREWLNMMICGKASLLLEENMSCIDLAARSAAATAKLKADIAAVDRLRQNLGVALKLTKVKSGRPKDRLDFFAEKKFGEIYDYFATVRSRPAHSRNRFTQVAIDMLKKELPAQDG